MTSKSDIIDRLQAIKDDLMSSYPIERLALFGSYAREDYTEQSDIDILVELNGKIGSRFIELADELENKLGAPVDLISRKGIKPKYFTSIQQDLIYV